MLAMAQLPCSEKDGLKKGPWTPEEDQKLLAYIAQHGHDGCWRSLSAKAGLQRCGKSCRVRWTNYLRPDIKRGKFSLQEEQTIIRLHAQLGNRWSAIATHLPRRCDEEIRRYWNTHLKKRLAKMGIDPVTHKPRSDDAPGTGGGGVSSGGQWESARLEAQAHMARAREASHLRTLAASAASVSPRRSRCPSTLSFPENRAQASVVMAEQSPTDVAATCAAMPEPMQQARKDHHLQRQKWGDHFIDAADADLVAAEFAGMLLDESLHQQQTEEEEKYWTNIMHLVNSPSASSSSSPASALEAPSSSASMQTSDAMPPAPKASSSAAAAREGLDVSRCARA